MSHLAKKVMISSTAHDLPEHREQVMHACMRLGMFYPEMMEHLTATDANALEVSLRMVDMADIYVGVFAFRYGYVPEGQTISVTEAEYNRAVERNIPRLLFLMDDEHPVKPTDVETGEGAEKLKEFKQQRLLKERVVAFFKSPEDLLAKVIQALVPYREPDLQTFHYVSDIPPPPEAFIAHPYTLLQTHRLVGRQPELNLLTDWVAKPDAEIYQAHILNIVAIGGLGKSALTWKWFNDIAPQEMQPLAGRMWWSFYESDATFENFVTRALAYATRRPLDEVQKIPAPERETQLLAALDREPFLLVLDGLERILIAYARMDAAHLSDDDYDKRTANFVANVIGLPESAAQTFTGEHLLRKTADPRAGAFLRKLSSVGAARILVSTRLYPADLQIGTGAPRPGCNAICLPGLANDDALELWRAFGVIGARDSLLPIFNRVGNHPLLVQALASEVARYRPAPGNFEQWRRAHPDFDPFSLPLVQVKFHVLEFALRGLDDKARQALHTIAGFRMPASYDTLVALLVGEGRACADECELNKVLTELEDRGLVGWDKRANRYDLHPIVRGVVWSGLGEDTRRGIYIRLHAHFEALPKIDNYLEVNCLEDITPAIEQYNTLIGLQRYDDAAELFFKYLKKVGFYRVTFNQQVVELLKMLFPTGLEQSIQLPLVSNVSTQASILTTLAAAYALIGYPEFAVRLYFFSNRFCKQHGDLVRLTSGLEELAHALCNSGSLYKSEIAGRESVRIALSQNNKFREARGQRMFGAVLAARGKITYAKKLLHRARQTLADKKLNDWEGPPLIATDLEHWEGATLIHISRYELWIGDLTKANESARNAWKLIAPGGCEPCSISAKNLEGLTALALGEIDTADKWLHIVLQRARELILPRVELEALIGLADLRRRQDNFKAAREFLDDVWAVAKNGPYRLIHADAYNILAQIERDKGDQAAAVDAATCAYRLAWCDGPPFAYHWGLVKARQHLLELGAPYPEMSPFDGAKFEPMPRIEIDWEGEFHTSKNVNK